MLFRQIKYFLAVVEAGSFTKAASRCFISQPAISQQIQALERDLGVELLHRKNRRFILTPAGETFYQRARLLSEEIERLRWDTLQAAQTPAPQQNERIGKKMKPYQFGYGCMRLPTLRQDDPASFDYEKIQALFDAYLAQGFTYFDTAYTYHGYHAEEAVRRALVERHPRDAFELATKMPLRDFKDSEDLENIFHEQLTHCGVDFFDYYLLHNMGTNVYEKCRKYDAFSFIVRKKEEGRIRHTGMSFHDTPELLDEILTQYGHCFDFVQLQINYADWEQPNVQSRRCLEAANRHGKPVFVMEPCKGGTLVNLPEEAERLLRSYAPNASNASWAMRFAASQPGVVRVLSGMNRMEQVLDNAAVFQNFRPLSGEETATLQEVRKIIEANTAVACTGCAYCTHGCPKDIAIPQYFALYNNITRTTGSFSSQAVYYNNTALTHGKASDCINCRQCEKACPQHLPIPEYLKQVAEKFEAGSSFPTRK